MLLGAWESTFSSKQNECVGVSVNSVQWLCRQSGD